MADGLERALERLRQGEDPGWLGWWRIRDGHTAEVYEALAFRLAEGRPARLTRRALDILADAVGFDRDLVAQPAILGLVVRGLVQESWHGAAAAHASGTVWKNADVYQRFQRYQTILQRAGGAALPAAIEVLAGAPLPAEVLENLRASPDEPFYLYGGAKPLALACVREWGGDGEVPLLRTLVASTDEPLLTRTLSASALHHLAGPGEIPSIGRHLVEPVLCSPGWRGSNLDGLAFLWPAVASQLVAALADPEYGVREHADVLLQMVGKPAIPALAEVVRDGSDWRALEHARRLLAGLDRAALRQAEHERETMDRGLSLVDDEPGAERGISRAEGGDG
ncbi:MAG: hypothetical protein HYU66_00860 [Armatimonadetes bacterium]|nr:hypothetical protein [Armatimonadota bacterium]